MGLEDTIGAELLGLRKRHGGITVAALAQTEALRTVLGGGDPRLAYNALKHLLLENEPSLALVAASYSLGFASEATTHLDRLSDFGKFYAYDQRQARRHSDAGIIELARRIVSERTLETAPVLEATILRADNVVLEVLLRTERLPYIEMQDPVVDAVDADGSRVVIPCEWNPATHATAVVAVTNVAVLHDGETSRALSVRWHGELWPRFVLVAESPLAGTITFQTLAGRMQVDGRW